MLGTERLTTIADKLRLKIWEQTIPGQEDEQTDVGSKPFLSEGKKRSGKETGH